MRPIARRSVVRSLLLAWTAGCSTWAPVALAPDPAGARPLPVEVRATLIDGRGVFLADPVVALDSLVGTEYPGRRRAFALAEVRGVQTREIDWARTGLVAGVLLTAFVLTHPASHSGYCDVACARR